ncbi:MAG: radical SAM protein [Nanoarchaeota archaeon]|nr:radical SAM protein [Nanoarchaeota archaeon]
MKKNLESEQRESAYMQITRKCNNACIFCSNPAFDKEIDIGEIEKRLNFYKSKGINEIVFSGGDPTESPILIEAIALATELGFKSKIITNGVNLFDLNYVKNLKKSGLEHLHISIHSHIDKDSDFLTSREGHLKKTIQGITNCIKEGLNVNINTTINSVNIKYLSGFIGYLIREFPQINHYVFNNLDIGESDKNLRSRAWYHKEVIARLSEIESELSRTVKLLIDNNKTFRIERVPLCYMSGFEQFATETRKIIKEESYRCIFIEQGRDDIYMELYDPRKERRYKGETCKSCKMSPICAGVCVEYFDLFGDSELFAIFDSPEKIISEVKENP